MKGRDKPAFRNHVFNCFLVGEREREGVINNFYTSVCMDNYSLKRIIANKVCLVGCTAVCWQQCAGIGGLLGGGELEDRSSWLAQALHGQSASVLWDGTGFPSAGGWGMPF